MAAMPVDLRLDGNEGVSPPLDLIDVLRMTGPEVMRRYPSSRALEELIARRFSVYPESVIVTAGADDALDRICRAVLTAGREMLVATPTFEMLPRYARLAGAETISVAWKNNAPYPIDEMLAAINSRTALVAVVTPNNPTGATCAREHIAALAQAAPHAVILLDHAYVEFAEDDMSVFAMQFDNVVVVRTLSKAWGLAGLRVGYAIGHREIVHWMRSAGGPYAVSRPSLAIAAARLERGDDDVRGFVDRVRHERHAIENHLRELRVEVMPSQGNFVFARFRDAIFVRDALASFGIAVRAFPGRHDIEDCLRITCPGEESAHARLHDAMRAAIAPDAILFDMDGVLADVSRSYRAAIVATAAHYGVAIEPAEIAHAKATGNANNDWVLTQRIMALKGIDRSLEEVTSVFERLYQGVNGTDGLRKTEKMLVPREFLEMLSDRCPLAIVTGRPRVDAHRFLDENLISGYFSEVICMEDGPLKPDPAPVRLAMERLGVHRAWMIGDTVDDIRSARGARAVPIGVLPPCDDPAALTDALYQAGAVRVMQRTIDLELLIQ